MNIGSLFANSGSPKDVKGLLKFQKAADDLLESYSKALLKYELALTNSFDKVKANETGLTFSNNMCSVAYYYEEDKSNVEQLERLYSSYGSTNEAQQSMVGKVKSCQREMKKLNMFTKAYADYVNSQRYLQDEGKGNGQMMIDKVDEVMDELKLDFESLDLALEKLKFETEEVFVSDHPAKIMLVPMLKDMEFLSQIIVKDQNQNDNSQILEDIANKRSELASSKDKRSREVEYLLKGSDKLKLYNNFYLKYNALLTQAENNMQNNPSGDKTQEEIEMGLKSLEQLDATYEVLKGIYTASN